MKSFAESSFFVSLIGVIGTKVFYENRVVNGWETTRRFIETATGVPELVRVTADLDRWRYSSVFADSDRRSTLLVKAGDFSMAIQRITHYAEDQKNGELLVGQDPGRREVVIDLGEDRAGHVTFTPDQARGLAALLIKHADEIDQLPAAVDPAERARWN